ncbi:unnamed protein product [Acanthoscelides obtectus]|uniref:Uncharacterized protein n=1 Tax=Acanthoscelides obtectus TaxID=200917 RepID=A0A9P0Q3B2_ACAOB|nr:unnamed protein product [Acanthoscelides obtectus]CAK1638472.1 hypothetical protein AOBTE_LOCUS10622 [Acanthoscelides obtectus]
MTMQTNSSRTSSEYF